jgi:two-component system NtrC family response regulator
LEKFERQNYQVVISDVRLPHGQNGLELVSTMLERKPDTTAIVITAAGTIETAVEAMRRGAFDFITKPVDLNLIRQQVRKAIEHHRLLAENRELRDRLADAGEISGIIGNCAAMQDVFRQIRQVADTNATVLIHGESGTGKELIARALHDLGDRSSGPFIAVNLGAMPESLLESELFGHEKGSFSGATRQKPGCFEQARGGTLFLDEVTEMPAKSQVDLLRVLETGRFYRVGGEVLQETDARIISATNRDVHTLIDEKKFREDLFYRLNVIPIEIPPLRERRNDIPLLVEHFLSHFCVRHNRPPKRIADDAMRALSAASWPGNVRQLRNLIERLVVTINGDVIQVADLPPDLLREPRQAATALMSLAEATEAAEKEAIQAALAARNFHREQTAKALGVSLRTLHYKMSRYGMH